MENEAAAARYRKEADEAAERSITAIEDVIVFTLKAGGEGQYHEAKRLCEVAQSLQKARGKRAGDFQEDDWKGKAAAGGNMTLHQYQQFHAAQAINRAVTNQIFTAGGTINTTVPFTITTAGTGNAVYTNATTYTA